MNIILFCGTDNSPMYGGLHNFKLKVRIGQIVYPFKSPSSSYDNLQIRDINWFVLIQ